MTKTDKPAFWKWVCRRKAHDNPRGHFIRDTRNLVRIGIDPASRLQRLWSNPGAE